MKIKRFKGDFSSLKDKEQWLYSEDTNDPVIASILENYEDTKKLARLGGIGGGTAIGGTAGGLAGHHFYKKKLKSPKTIFPEDTSGKKHARTITESGWVYSPKAAGIAMGVGGALAGAGLGAAANALIQNKAAEDAYNQIQNYKYMKSLEGDQSSFDNLI